VVYLGHNPLFSAIYFALIVAHSFIYFIFFAFLQSFLAY